MTPSAHAPKPEWKRALTIWAFRPRRLSSVPGAHYKLVCFCHRGMDGSALRILPSPACSAYSLMSTPRSDPSFDLCLRGAVPRHSARTLLSKSTRGLRSRLRAGAAQLPPPFLAVFGEAIGRIAPQASQHRFKGAVCIRGALRQEGTWLRGGSFIPRLRPLPARVRVEVTRTGTPHRCRPARPRVPPLRRGAP